MQPDCAAFTEMIEATGAGRLFEPANTGALVSEWEKLLGNPAEAHALGMRGRAAAEREYTITRMAERFVELTKAAIPGALAAVEASS